MNRWERCTWDRRPWVVRSAVLMALAGALVLPLDSLRAQDAGTSGDDATPLADPVLTEWEVPYPDTRPRDPFVAPDGQVWFVGQAGHYVAAFDPETADFTRVDLDDGTGPHNLIVGGDGTVWYAGNRARHIGKVDPATGAIEKFMMPDEAARDPRGLGSSRPYGIKMDSEGRPWIVLFNTNMIATVDPDTFEPRIYGLPDGTRPRRLVLDSRDRIWFVDYARGRLGMLDPATGEIGDWAMPGGEGARPYAMAIDAADRIWFVETGTDPNHFVGFDPSSEEFFSRVPVESGGGAVRHMHYDERTNTIWFGADTNTIGRAVLPPTRPVS